MIPRCPAGTETLSHDVREILTLARLHDPAPRTPGFLINYGLSARVALALIRGGWSTVNDLDRSERAWRTAVDHGMDRPFHSWLSVPHLGGTGAARLRETLAYWRDDHPAESLEDSRTNRIVAAVREEIAAGALEHGRILPNMAHLARRYDGKPVDAGKACHVLVLAGWCAWRRKPDLDDDDRDRRIPIVLVPGTPYSVHWQHSLAAPTRARAADAVELLRHNPGAWQAAEPRHTLRGLAPITDATMEDARRALTVNAVSRRRVTRTGTSS